eukprot:GHVR01096400.1.p1 GENE.GHVR01096400.1~~GHVR01096400.1.p1  ORF type:complete len:166 (+),score=17.72 GHVR01096400.1:121-618(+)
MTNLRFNLKTEEFIFLDLDSFVSPVLFIHPLPPYPCTHVVLYWTLWQSITCVWGVSNKTDEVYDYERVDGQVSKVEPSFGNKGLFSNRKESLASFVYELGIKRLQQDWDGEDQAFKEMLLKCFSDAGGIAEVIETLRGEAKLRAWVGVETVHTHTHTPTHTTTQM